MTEQEYSKWIEEGVKEFFYNDPTRQAIRAAIDSICHKDDCSGSSAGEVEEAPLAKVNQHDRMAIFVKCAGCGQMAGAEING